MQRLDPKGDPSTAVRDGYYVAPVDAPAPVIASSLDLRPNGSHLFIGPIGSGKTTQLRVLEAQLRDGTSVTPAFVDVGAVHDVSAVRPGVLIFAAATEVAALVAGTPQSAHQREWLRKRARGAFWDHEPDFDYPYEDDGTRWAPGVLRPPADPWGETVAGARKAVEALLSDAEVEGVRPEVTVLFDGLDRLHDLEAFERVVAEDVRALQACGIGVVIAASQRLLYGASTEIRRHFDRVHRIGAADPLFLRSVLRSRADAALLSDAAADRIAEWSGGVLRDLIAIAQGAGEEAYVRGADLIGVEHVDAAANRFGRALLLGVETQARATLELVLTTDSFAIGSDSDVQLLVEDRLIDLGGRYVVHPTLVPLLHAA